MIPKIVHYAWFGSPLPISVKRRVEEWKQQLPEWKFRLWSEDNFDLSRFGFSKEMYDSGKLGYAADELRYEVLRRYGGFYFDTDMIVKKPLDTLLNYRMVWGFQYDNSLLTSFFGSEPGMPLLDSILKVYANEKYPDLHSDLYEMTSNPFVTKIFLREFERFRTDGTRQSLTDGIEVFPRDYFSYPSRNLKANYMEHLFDNSWGDSNLGIKGRFKAVFKRVSPFLWAEISARRGIRSAEDDGVPHMKPIHRD